MKYVLGCCPWGHEAEMAWDEFCFPYVGCSDYNCIPAGPVRNTKEEAVEAWNRLVGPPRSPDDPRLWELLPEWVQYVTWCDWFGFCWWEDEPVKSLDGDEWLPADPGGPLSQLHLILDHGDDEPKIWPRL